MLLAINNADTPPFGTLIKVNQSTCGLTQPTAPPPGVTAPDKILFNAAGGVNATNGAEQPVWDPATGRFYLSIPQIGLNASSGGVVRIRSRAPQPRQRIEHDLPDIVLLAGRPHQGPEQRFPCRLQYGLRYGRRRCGARPIPQTAAPIQVILNVKTGDVDQVGGVGVGDEVWFNKGDNNYYTAARQPLPRSPLRRPLDRPAAPAVLRRAQRSSA